MRWAVIGFLLLTDRFMKRIIITLFAGLLFITGCQSKIELPEEPWINQSIKKWPEFALTNTISFKDTIFKNLANSFLVDTGTDTLGVSCKHLFMAFVNHPGLTTIDLGKEFEYWKMYPKNNPENNVTIENLINRNPDEAIGQFNTLKNRDWIIFEIAKGNSNLYPLKIRYAPVRKNEIVYAIGWGAKQKNIKHPAKIGFKNYKSVGNYYYMSPLETDANPHGRSGSPVVDKHGYLVGITSGAEGKLAIIGGVEYLQDLFDQYNIDYKTSYSEVNNPS